MNKFAIYFCVTLLLLGSSAFAIPNLQIFVDGGTYDFDTQSWVTTSSTFNLYVIGANVELSNVLVSMALINDKGDDPNGAVSVDVDGTAFNSWTYGYSPLATAGSWDQNEDLPRHGIFPAWFAEFSAGDFGLVGGIGDVQPQPDYWDPSIEGYLTGAKARGEFKVFTIDVTGASFVHFDAYTLNPDGSVQYFAPFSHDGGMVPEPGTLLLLGLGMAGLGIGRKLRK